MAENDLKIAHPFNKPKFEIAVLREEENYCKIEVSPLERGYGLTLGNAMRRVLLSSLPGTSVYAIEVEGAVHEFSAIKGVEEDLTEIILNLKDLVLESDTVGEAEYEITVDVDGEKVLTAGDLDTPAGLTVINKELIIAHVCEDSHLHMVLHVKNGRGYATSEENKEYTFDELNKLCQDKYGEDLQQIDTPEQEQEIFGEEKEGHTGYPYFVCGDKVYNNLDDVKSDVVEEQKTTQEFNSAGTSLIKFLHYIKNL